MVNKVIEILVYKRYYDYYFVYKKILYIFNCLYYAYVLLLY